VGARATASARARERTEEEERARRRACTCVCEFTCAPVLASGRRPIASEGAWSFRQQGWAGSWLDRRSSFLPFSMRETGRERREEADSRGSPLGLSAGCEEKFPALDRGPRPPIRLARAKDPANGMGRSCVRRIRMTWITLRNSARVRHVDPARRAPGRASSHVR